MAQLGARTNRLLLFACFITLMACNTGNNTDTTKVETNKNKIIMTRGVKMATKVILTQMQATLGFKLFGEKAFASIVKELKQLKYGPMPGKQVIMAIDPDMLSLEQKRRALNAVNLIKQKIDGSIKGRTCADGSGQHKLLSVNESIASFTLSLEALFVILIVDSFEKGTLLLLIFLGHIYMH